MKQISTYILLLTCLLTFKSNAQLTVSGYTNYTLAGFNVLVEDAAITTNEVLTTDAIDLLEIKLIEISQFNIDPIQLDALKAVPIFMDWNTTSEAAQYHPSEEWLISNGYIPEKAMCVEISNISNFINWTNQNQPYMILHELAHAYHHRVLNFNSPTITNAFNNAVSNNLYTNGSYHTGGGSYINQATAYALNNENEYFAEITEAYFGLNDYFPFDNNDLNNYDLVGFNAALFVWGDITLSLPSSGMNTIESSVFPNPTKGLILLDIDDSTMNRITYEVFDIHGRSILNSVSTNIEAPIELNITRAHNGLYFLRLVEGNRSKTFKIIKE
jgi:hypothetical protein